MVELGQIANLVNVCISRDQDVIVNIILVEGL